MTRTHLVAIMTPMVKSLLGSALTAAILVSCLWLTGGAEAAELDREYFPIAESSSVGVHVAARASEPMTHPITRTGQPRVDLNRLGLLLQVIGFSMIAVIAGMILDRGFTDTLSDRIERWLSSTARNLDTVTARMARLPIVARVGVLPTEEDGRTIRTLSSLRSSTFVEALKGTLWMLLITAIMCLPLIALIAGALEDVRWLFWLGVALMGWSLFSVFCMMFLLISVRPVEWSPGSALLAELLRHVVAIYYTFTGCFGVVGYQVVATAVWALFLVIASCLKPFHVSTVFLSRSDMLRRILLVTGTLAVLSGLILQYVALR